MRLEGLEEKLSFNFWYNAHVEIDVLSLLLPTSLTEGDLFSPSFFNSAKKNTNSLQETACWQIDQSKYQLGYGSLLERKPRAIWKRSHKRSISQKNS